MRSKLVYILSNISISQSFIWIAKGINREKIHLHFIFLNPRLSDLENRIKDLGIETYRIHYKGKKDFPLAWLKCLRLLRSIKPDIVHTHLLEANLIGLSAAWLVRIKKRIHTRHHGDLHHINFPRGVWFDRLVNLLSTDVIAPSNVARKVLVEMDHIKPGKVKIIHHGFDFSEFTDIHMDRIQKLREKYRIDVNEGPVVGVISRWTEWKGVHIAIKAFIEYLNDHPKAVIILANAGGDYEMEIRRILMELKENNFRVIEFEEDIAALYKIFDIFVHVPIRETAEAFGQTYIEALVAGVPFVFTRCGVIGELEQSLELDFVKMESSYDVLKKLQTSVSLPIINGYLEEFTSSTMVDRLEQLYQIT